jgi:hypothetical protein
MFCLGLVVLTSILAFGAATSAPFLNWDDDRNFVANADYRGIGADQFRWAWDTYHLGVWQPLSWLLFGVQWQVGGLQPLVYHGVSLALHALNCMLFYLLLRRLLSPNPQNSNVPPDGAIDFAAIAGTVLFACHPLRVEPVVWISCQPYLPAVACYLLSILAYLQVYSDPHRPRYVWYLASFGCFAAAVMFKAIAVSLPAVFLILDLYVLRRREAGANAPRARWTTLLLEKLPFFLVLIPVSAWAVAAKDFNESRVAWADIHLGERVAQSAYGIVFYLQKTLLPIGLSPYYRIADDLALTTGRYVICIIMSASVTIVLFLRRNRSPRLLAAWLAYVVILLPNLGVVQFSQQLAADRYSYLGIMPILAVVAAAIADLWRIASHRPSTRPALVIALTVLCLANIYGSRSYARHWLDSLSLWQRVLDLDPDCPVAHCNFGDALLREDRTAEASRHFAAAIDLDPNFSFAYANFAALLVRAGRLDDAVFAAQRALAKDSPLRGRDLARAHAILGEAYAAQRRDDLAWHHTLLAKELGFAEAQKMIDYLSRFSSPPTTRPAQTPQN